MLLCQCFKTIEIKLKAGLILPIRKACFCWKFLRQKENKVIFCYIFPRYTTPQKGNNYPSTHRQSGPIWRESWLKSIIFLPFISLSKPYIKHLVVFFGGWGLSIWLFILVSDKWPKVICKFFGRLTQRRQTLPTPPEIRGVVHPSPTLLRW